MNKIMPVVKDFIRANKQIIFDKDWDRLYSESALISAGLNKKFELFPSITNALENAGYNILEDIDYIPNYFQFSSSRTMLSGEIPDNIKYIGKMCYFNTFWQEGIKIPEGVITIGESAFADCYATPRIDIPASVQWIKKEAFTGTIVIDKIIYYGGTINQWKNDILYVLGPSGKRPFEGTDYIIKCLDGEINANDR